MKIKMGQDHCYQTRSGKSVRILAIDSELRYHGYTWPVVALIDNKVVGHWTDEGKATRCDETPLDIIEKPQSYKRTFWVNIYPLGRQYNPEGIGSYNYSTEHAARTNASDNVLETVQVTIEGTVPTKESK